MKYIGIIIFIPVVFAYNSKAATITEILPVTNKVIMIHVDDGSVSYHQCGQLITADVVQVNPFDTINGFLISSYQVSSISDANYSSPLSPVSVYRKSKATEYANYCQGWNGNCVNATADRAMEHWVYLELPYEMQPGNIYTINTGNLATNGNNFNLNFDPFQVRSEAVHVNTIGYLPTAQKKYGYIYHWLGDGGSGNFNFYNGKSFYIVDSVTNQVVYTGAIAYRKPYSNQEFAYPYQSAPYGNLLGSDVYECDFSAFQTPGTYKLVVEKLGCSFAFEIGCNVYRPVFRQVMKGIFHQRSGIERTQPYSDFYRPADHNPNLTPGFAQHLKYTTARYCDYLSSNADPFDTTAIQNGYQGLINTWGWYHDAGDWDTYYSESNVPAMLFMLYEIAGNRLTDDTLAIPESGNGIPDLIDEGLWQMRYYYRTRQAIQTAGYGTGGVGGSRTFGDLWGPDISGDTARGSWNDTHRDWYVSGEDPFITFKYAGLAAQAATIFNALGLTDPQGVDWADEAVQSYQWAINHTLPGDEIPKFNGELNILFDRLFASASLYRLTGDVAYHNQFLTDIDTAMTFYTTGNNNRDLYLAYWMYVMASTTQQVNQQKLNAITIQLIDDADFLMIDFYDTRACRWAGNFWYNMLVGQGTTPMVETGLVAAAIFTNPNSNTYLQNSITTADYFLGNNPLNMTWVTGMGDRSPQQIFSLDNFCINANTPYPGIIPFGPHYNQYLGPLGPWNINWANSTVHPGVDDWPGHERWWNNRNAPLNSEYTVPNLANNALVYGALCGLCQISTGITQPVENAQAQTPVLICFPDPAANSINLHANFPLESVEIYAADGRLLISDKNVMNEIYVGNLPPGFFLLKAFNLHKNITGQTKFIKK